MTPKQIKTLRDHLTAKTSKDEIIKLCLKFLDQYEAEQAIPVAQPVVKPQVDTVAFLKTVRENLLAFANSPAASKSGESITAHDKVAFLDGLIGQLSAATSSKAAK